MGLRTIGTARSTKLGVTKIFVAVAIGFLIIAFGSTAQIQKQSDCASPPWFNSGKDCTYKQKPYHYYENGIYINQQQRGCKEVVLVCGTTMVRESTVNKDPGCPEEFWPEFKDGDEVCCEAFQKAVNSKKPCDASKDADCDGIPNESDRDPLVPGDPDADKQCEQLRFDVYGAYKKAGANLNVTATDASYTAEADCMRRKKAKMCGNPVPDEWPPEDPKFPKDPDTDNKCKQLGSDVHNAYLKAGANENTASYAGTIARQDCMKRRADKM